MYFNKENMMKIRFWGVRGSLASPGIQTTRYGGNTSCVEVSHRGHSLILDAGTGLSQLGHKLILAQKKSRSVINLFLTHYHFDHICGLPFFRPVYKKKNLLNIVGPGPSAHDVKKVFKKFFSADFFPVTFSSLPAKITYASFKKKPHKVGPFTVDSFRLNHPSSTLGYRITDGKTSVAYLCDHEPIDYCNHLNAKDKIHYQNKLTEWLSDIDVLITDSHYFNHEYPSHKGWGHSPWSYSIQLAQQAKAKKLVLFHHSPMHSDTMLTKTFQKLKKVHKKIDWPKKICLAREGLTIGSDA
jgi:phosphoribosyl 1,2-cyclic phosphodiesterase